MMHELKINREIWRAVNHALISIDAVVGNEIAVTIILHDTEGGIYTMTDGPPGELDIRLKPRAND